MNCPKCNAPLQNDDAFCSSCGAFISQDAPLEPTTSENSQTPDSLQPPWLTSTLPPGEPVSSHTQTPHPQAITSNYTHPFSGPSSTTTPYEPGVVPDEIKKWNWGAFTYTFIWGIGNYTYLPLLCFIPIFNLIWVFVCGAKGNEWAWRSGKFNNVEDFVATQQTWNLAGLVAFILGLVGFAFNLLYTLANLAWLLS